MRLELDANPNLYSPERLQQHVARLAAFIDAAVASERLGDVPTLTADEHHHWVEGVNQTVHPVEDTTLTALIERESARRLARLGGSQPSLTEIPRRRFEP